MRYVTGTKLDERIVRCDLDLGYSEGRQFGRGKSGGQVQNTMLAGQSLIHASYRFEMSTDRTMTLAVVDGVRRFRWTDDANAKNCMPTLVMRSLQVAAMTGKLVFI